MGGPFRSRVPPSSALSDPPVTPLSLSPLSLRLLQPECTQFEETVARTPGLSLVAADGRIAVRLNQPDRDPPVPQPAAGAAQTAPRSAPDTRAAYLAIAPVV
jgi:hypothetical protein